MERLLPSAKAIATILSPSCKPLSMAGVFTVEAPIIGNSVPIFTVRIMAKRKAKRKLCQTPPKQIINLCQAGFFSKLYFSKSSLEKTTPSKSRTSSSSSPFAVEKSPLPAASSPSIAQLPPKGRSFKLYLVLWKTPERIRGPIPIENSKTPTLKNFAAKKWPNS